MEKSLKILLIIVIVGFFASFIVKNALASSVPYDVIEEISSVTVVYVAKGETVYTRVEVEKMSSTVKSAVMARFSAFTIDEVYKGNDDTYKVVLKNGEKKLTVYYSAGGEFIKKETSTISI